MVEFANISSGFGFLTFTNLPSSYNLTTVQCMAEHRVMDRVTFSVIARLKLQGWLAKFKEAALLATSQYLQKFRSPFNTQEACCPPPPPLLQLDSWRSMLNTKQLHLEAPSLRWRNSLIKLLNEVSIKVWCYIMPMYGCRLSGREGWNRKSKSHDLWARFLQAGSFWLSWLEFTGLFLEIWALLAKLAGASERFRQVGYKKSSLSCQGVASCFLFR